MTGAPFTPTPLVSVPSVGVGEVVFSRSPNVECSEVVEPLRHLRVLLGGHLSNSEDKSKHAESDVANHLIPLIFSRLHQFASAQRLANIRTIPMPLPFLDALRVVAWVTHAHASFWYVRHHRSGSVPSDASTYSSYVQGTSKLGKRFDLS